MVTSVLLIGSDTIWNGGADVESGRASTAAEAFASLSRRSWDVIVAGRVPDATNDSLLASLARRYPAIPVVAVMDDPGAETRRHAWELVRPGGPVDDAVHRAAELSRLRREVLRLGSEREDVVVGPVVARAFEQGSVREMERLMIEARLGRLNQNRTHAAASLEISVRTLRNKLREYRESPRVESAPVEPR
jgi:DNA-binding NtrC family response regulator